jgi:GLPGLI family protein
MYDYKFVSDTLKKNDVSDEIVVLDFNGKEQRSIFTGLKHIISDSTMPANAKRGIMSFPDASTKIKYVVEKNISDDIVYFYTPDHTSEDVLKVEDDRKINWELSNEKENIIGYSVQKATTFFAGRKWTAWFAPDIPIPDGPYKFHGLPGLILKISDETNTHSFEIISIQKQKSNYLVLNEGAYKGAKQITQNKYEKMPDPLEQFRNKAFTDEMIFRSDEERQQFLKDIDTNIKEGKIHDNNPIELLDVKK